MGIFDLEISHPAGYPLRGDCFNFHPNKDCVRLAAGWGYTLLLQGARLVLFLSIPLYRSTLIRPERKRFLDLEKCGRLIGLQECRRIWGGRKALPS